uniref:Integrase zinc-binding domain-containing protein n=1 Tax=Accipiter nisus TaxID=211598 RepID=A0A8B9MW72_9AVES
MICSQCPQSNTTLVWWTHEKTGHGGRDATIPWAKTRGVQLSVKDIQTRITQCETCQLLKRHPYLDQLVVWQINYVGPLPSN